MFPPGQDGLSPIDPDAGVPGLPDWQVIPTPGHTPGHLALFREADRTLIAGDAVLTVNLNSPGDALSQRHTLGGPPRFATWNWRAATGSVSELARLEPGVLAPGHGRPMTGPVLAPALRALGEQPCQRWQRGLIRGPQADGAGPQLLRLQSPRPLTAPRCSRTIALLTANGVRRLTAPRRQSLRVRRSPQPRASPTSPPAKAPVRPSTRKLSGDAAMRAPWWARCRRMDFDARPVNAGSPWSRVPEAAPATSSRPSDASHSRTPGPPTAPLPAQPRSPASSPACLLRRATGVFAPAQTTRYSSARRRGSG